MNPGHHDVIDDPKQIAAKIDVHPAGRERYHTVKRRGQVIMFPVRTYTHSTTVYDHVQRKAAKQRYNAI